MGTKHNPPCCNAMLTEEQIEIIDAATILYKWTNPDRRIEEMQELNATEAPIQLSQSQSSRNKNDGHGNGDSGEQNDTNWQNTN